ncbi:PilW family protein [Halopseudomonas pelagia]|uniref:PilW family protein n=1 Tax=Halopseudomonas pelagia TaxID=553151 RepID=UPI0003A11005|nr:PilW family protein [Halopseudomonas pelagia]
MTQILRRTQRGLSIIELMIALAISSLLILGVTQIYIDNKSNFFFQQGQSDNTENARYTLLILEEELRRVGYQIRPDDDPTYAFRIEAVGNCSFVAGETINYDATNRRLCLRYQPHVPGLTACDGIAQPGPPEPYELPATPSNLIVDLTFTGNSLLCNDQPVFDNVVDLQLEFGVSNNDSRQADAYTSTPGVNQSIQSVRYAALVKSRYDNIASDNQSPAYEYWQETYNDNEGADAPDRALYLVTESTINLRNLTR